MSKQLITSDTVMVGQMGGSALENSSEEFDMDQLTFCHLFLLAIENFQSR